MEDVHSRRNRPDWGRHNSVADLGRCRKPGAAEPGPEPLSRSGCAGAGAGTPGPESERVRRGR